MPVLSQSDIDEFLSTTVYGLLKNDKSITPQFIERQKELLSILKNDKHLATIRSSKTKMSLLHAAASNNALLLGKHLVDHVNDLILKYDPNDVEQEKAYREEQERLQALKEASSPSKPAGGPGGRRKSQMETIMMRSAENYDPKGVDFIDLMESEDLSKMTPLMYAGFEGNLTFIDLLCDNGADLLAQDELGQTALHWAVQGGEHPACSLLLSWERGAQALCLSDKLGQTPVDIARTYDRRFLHIRNHKSLLEVLAKEYTDIKIPSVGFQTRQEKKAKFLARFGTNRLGTDIPILTRESLFKGKRPKTRTEFRDLAGGWMP
mmetsp:Transcript_20268/g.51196  ORF Transcript_20268/g.51196 Transcript_20268/m.51196 type:complete len:321 (+) Transcript_20268:1044-2006(+)|eukprot:CAMPEP_0179009856 /NCGR_PEP_ID=MMETSP0795-20121207/16495_1 /TAXON_ID=88552 /ORGANISM="Amoebophrya sp., Strain Ameob2" /LENGTH=320 /DNA_ID=CAMNT_0020705081 /DNA_START=790 /DNA_END=1752 /DNA_ORIENTATION=-